MTELTLAEKASLCLGADFWHTAAVPRAGIESLAMSDGPHGLRKQPDEGDHVGIGGSLPATCFPTASALGSSWDPDLARRVGAAIGREARSQGVRLVLGPGINIKRSPLCGRNFEYLSEDPLVSGVLGAGVIEGLQSHGVAASLKHYAVNNQETDRLRVSADVDERTLREIYLRGFEIAVTTAHPWTVMCSYNRVNGTHASQHHWLLTEVLRDEWGFDGLVVSDWGAVHDRVAALRAGLDLEMPPNLGVSDRTVIEAVRDGSLDEAVLDVAVGRVRQLLDRTSVADPVPGDLDADAHHALARAAAADCAVLLKNVRGVLPLTPVAGETFAVVGEFARTPRFQGAGSSQVNPTRVDVVVEELRAALPAGVALEFAAGFTIPEGPEGDDVALADEAVALAARADQVVVVVGLPAEDESEGFDRTRLDLPANQVDLLHRLTATHRDVVVVLVNGSVVRLSDWDGGAAAVLETWLAGQAAGGAVADLLLGQANPSGRLAETIPLRLADNPSYLNFPGEDGHVRYGEGIFVGYRGYDARAQDVAYPFGHGLSYTTFSYDDLVVTVDDQSLDITCSVTNTGARAGHEVVQVYVGHPCASVARPPRELRAFAKVALEPGEQRTVAFHLTSRDLAHWSTRTGGWLVETGDVEVSVGASSRDLQLTTTVAVDAPRPDVALDGMSTLQEWLADPSGGPALRAAVGTDENGHAQGIIGNDELLRVIGNFPISTLAAFPGVGITHDLVEHLTNGQRA